MRLTLQVFGFELDVTLGRETQDAADEDVYVDCGAVTSYPVGFTRSPLPDWEDPGSYHTFDPEPDGEDT